MHYFWSTSPANKISSWNLLSQTQDLEVCLFVPSFCNYYQNLQGHTIQIIPLTIYKSLTLMLFLQIIVDTIPCPEKRNSLKRLNKSSGTLKRFFLRITFLSLVERCLYYWMTWRFLLKMLLKLKGFFKLVSRCLYQVCSMMLNHQLSSLELLQWLMPKLFKTNCLRMVLRKYGSFPRVVRIWQLKFLMIRIAHL